MAIHFDIVLQAVAVKQPLSRDADRAEELLVDHQWLQELSGHSGVPRLLGVCKDNHARTCIITSPVGKALTWELWDSNSGTSLPLHHALLGLARSSTQSSRCTQRGLSFETSGRPILSTPMPC